MELFYLYLLIKLGKLSTCVSLANVNSKVYLFGLKSYKRKQVINLNESVIK